MQNTNWDIFRYVIAVAEAGSAVAAAERLGVNASTVLRRISRFEDENGIRLFERHQSGYRPTAACAAVVEAARDIEQSVAGISRDLLGSDFRLEGGLTVTTTDSLLFSVLAPMIREFSLRHPRICLDISVTTTRLNLTRQDADVAIRPSKQPPETLVGQRVSGLAFAVYGSREKLAAIAPAKRSGQMDDARWVGIGQALTGSMVGNWMKENVPAERIAMTADTFVAMHDCVAAGAGLAALPCCIGDRSRYVMRVTDPLPAMDTSLWVLTHADIRNAARVKAFMEYIARALRSQSDCLEGSASQAQ
ncbi:LysR family transcriptional regulator [Hoeflea prorocentri]|uniref:LysR family transcriptional regulator n=1 Tax=Hoeflea prorocentri TaxID=1922333 RepID=A0A9X3UI24_9HYPH|nr:LysR family transcriptional regulator [Hoeflea prorocentri]MCY6381054.1 LysR family transcriptional regulator [Hoeflea prorocentri]MDA5398854.1 LysR family transcriptional regulator [Hoeflea prorocentri]